MKRKFRIILSAVSIVFLFASYSFGMGAAQKHEEKLKVGAVLPLTGKISFLGERTKNGILLAQDKIVNQGKNNIEIIFADSKSQPKDAVSASNKLINVDKVDALIVFGTAMVNAVYPITERNKIPLIAQTIYPQITKKGSYIIQYFGGGSHEWKVVGEFLNSRSLRNIVVFSMNSQYGRDCHNILKNSLETRNIVNIIYEFGNRNFTNIVAKYRKRIVEADAVVLIGYPADSFNIVKTISEAGIRKELYVGTEAFLDKKILESKLFQNSIAVVPRMLIEGYQSNGYKQLRSEFENKFGSPLSFEALYGFLDTILLSKVGIEGINDKLNNFKFDNGIGEEVPFVNREANTPVGIGMVKEGKITAIK